MIEEFNKYKIAIVDASFFVTKFDDELREELKNITIYLAKTFYVECEQIKILLNSIEKMNFESNLRFLEKETVLKYMENLGAYEEQYNDDTFYYWSGM